jgi:hypothetical protein
MIGKNLARKAKIQGEYYSHQDDTSIKTANRTRAAMAEWDKKHAGGKLTGQSPTGHPFAIQQPTPATEPMLTPEMLGGRTFSGLDTEQFLRTEETRAIKGPDVIRSIIPGFGGKGKARPYRYIGVHYTAGNSLKSAINTAAGSNVGYNYLIDKDGTVHMVRDPEEGYANHWGGIANVHGSAKNQNSIGVSFVGHEGKATPAQIKSGVQFIEKLRTERNIDPKNVLGHGEVTSGHRSHTEGMDILKPFRQLHGIKDPNISTRTAALANWNKQHRADIGAPGENMPVHLKSAIEKLRAPSMFEASDKIAEMRKSGVLPAVKSLTAPPPPKEIAPPGIGPSPEETKPVMNEKDAILDMGDTEQQSEIKTRAADISKDKEIEEKEEADRRGKGGPGGGASSSQFESRPASPGSQGLGSFGRCFLAYEWR